MSGHIRCAKCEKNLTLPVCPTCGGIKCYIFLYWKGIRYKFRKYPIDNLPLIYQTANIVLSEIRTAINKGTFKPEDWLNSKIAERRFNVQVNKWLNLKQSELDNNELAPETYRKYLNTSLKYLMPYFKNCNVRDIDREGVEKFKDFLRKKKFSIKYCNDLLGILHSFMMYLYKKGIINKIPPIERFSGDDSKVRVAADYDEQIEALGRLPERFRDMVEFSMETGLRVGELCALKKRDLKLEKYEALIQRTWSGSKLRETTKARNKKKIPLSYRAVEILKKYIPEKFPDQFVFQFKPHTLQNVWKKYCASLRISLYEITRHSFCTQIVEIGINTLQAKELMRHADIRSTEKYFHASVRKLRDIVNARSKVINIYGSGVVPYIAGKP